MTTEQSRYIEGNTDCSLWETDSGWELRMTDGIRTLGPVSVEEAVSNLHAAQIAIIRTRRWVA